jgi:predicted nuclease of restriction endonuclease-like RecB superfamily
MLTSDLIRFHYRGPDIYPSYIKTGEKYLATAVELIDILINLPAEPEEN